MKKYIYVSSNGLMPIESFSMMGVSTKREDEEAIGMFGTGLKYSIAGLLNRFIDVFIVTNGETIPFGTKQIEVKGELFNQVRYRPPGKKRWKDLGFSAEMGLQWELEDALREIVSNAIDEGGCEFTDYLPEGKGKTVVAIERTPEVYKYFNEIDKYFLLNREPIFVGPTCSLYAKHDDHVRIYHKGVLVYEEVTKNSLYDYDFKEVEVDETRRSNFHEVKSEITKGLFSVPEGYILPILQAISTDDSLIEKDCSTYYTPPEHQVLTWANVVGKDTVVCNEEALEHFGKYLKEHETLILPYDWMYLLNRNDIGRNINSVLTEEQKANFDPYELDTYEAGLLSSAKKFIEGAGFDLSGIEICPFQSVHNDLLGNAIGGKIWISDLAFRNGKKDLVDTILHEYFHIQSGAEDETREFERYIISELVKQLELKTGDML